MTPHPAPLTPHGFFVTGTDTGVGKTLVSCALLHACAARGKSVIGMKPVAAGAVETARGLINDDVTALRAAGTVEAPADWVNPYCFKPPIAPHIAAEQAGMTIDIDRIAHAYARLTAMADIVVVEGAGGLCVPLNHDHDSADLACRLELPVILVVGLRLGCLNHALLTARALRARGLGLAAWVANCIDPAMAVQDENIAALQRRLRAPRLGTIGYESEPDARRVAAALDLSTLDLP